MDKDDEDQLDLNDLDVDDEEDSPGVLEIEICGKYYSLLQDPMIRIALSGVVVSEGRISTSKTRQKLTQWFKENGYKPFENSQLQLTTFLNTIWFAGCENLSSEFWWVHKVIIQKLLYVCTVAEACNLQQYGITSSKSHLPRSAMFIHDYISSLDDETFAELESEFDALSKTHEDLCRLFINSFDSSSSESSSKSSTKKTKSKK